jgi:hypothetical protein
VTASTIPDHLLVECEALGAAKGLFFVPLRVISWIVLGFSANVTKAL